MKLTLLLIPLLLLSSCSIDWNDEKDKKITELEKQVQDLKNTSSPFIFERQKECLTYKGKIEESVKTTNIAWEEGRKKLGRNDYTHNEYFNEIFYSPKKNSCLYGVMVTEIQDGKDCSFYKIYDHLSGNNTELGMYLEFIKDANGGINDICNYNASKNAYMKALKELKGE